MRSVALPAALLAVALSAPPAAASCVVIPAPVLPTEAAAGGTVRVPIPSRAPCNDTVPPPGTSPAPEPPVRVESFTLSLVRRGERVTIARYRQGEAAITVTARIPAGTAPGTWALETSLPTRLVDDFRVLPPGTLPRTGRTGTGPLAAFGVLLLAAGSYAVVRAKRWT